MGMAHDVVKIKTGSFVGAGNASQTISVGFEPDIIIVNCSALDFGTAGWHGQKNVIIVKNMIVYQGRHNNDTQTIVNSSAGDNVGGDYPEYGITNGYYLPYGIYQEGDFTISNGTINSINTFVNGYTYDWIAIKYS